MRNLSRLIFGKFSSVNNSRVIFFFSDSSWLKSITSFNNSSKSVGLVSISRVPDVNLVISTILLNILIDSKLN